MLVSRDFGCSKCMRMSVHQFKSANFSWLNFERKNDLETRRKETHWHWSYWTEFARKRLNHNQPLMTLRNQPWINQFLQSPLIHHAFANRPFLFVDGRIGFYKCKVFKTNYVYINHCMSTCVSPRRRDVSNVARNAEVTVTCNVGVRSSQLGRSSPEAVITYKKVIWNNMTADLQQKAGNMRVDAIKVRNIRVNWWVITVDPTAVHTFILLNGYSNWWMILWMNGGYW